ncbi:flagellar filament capping protein FliD [Paenibacillus paeoniae]|uniref:Flagellar hook-associated protein 2 n=1 Tax=Paenibacillus paeoniae TaxID=2292705 RepID=A0A371P1T7_9BACL|nr:flagellar filament capping protein FliD [Paenibacillus paeoniae]REK69568.1 flagellar cap protein FliD [Paenibacillus paeoniae]
MRLSGLASGLDVDAMVKELMKAKRATYDKVVKQKTQLEWKREDYRTISSKIVDFRNNKLANYNLSNAINAKTSNVSGAANSIRINATNSTASGSLEVKVEQLATNTREVFDIGTGNLAVGEVQINGESITLDGDMNGAQLAKIINGNSKYKATALYNEQTGQISITAKESGAIDSAMLVSGIANRNAAASDPGKTAVVHINGMRYEQNSNRFVINGVDFTAVDESDNSATISVTKDTTKTVDTIKAFISEYNSLISLVNGELSEEKFRNYMPLTTDEKSALSEKEVELLESKARSGLLRRDTTLTKLISDLRSTATALVGGAQTGENSYLSVGITTGSYTEKGKLVLDEEKLRSALDSNPEEVTALFTGSNGVFRSMMDSSMSALKDLNKIAGTSLTSSDTAFTFMHNSTIGEQLKSMESRESQMLTRLNMMEIQYYKQFTAMEKAINKFNSQSSSLSSFM